MSKKCFKNIKEFNRARYKSHAHSMQNSFCFVVFSLVHSSINRIIPIDFISMRKKSEMYNLKLKILNNANKLT